MSKNSGVKGKTVPQLDRAQRATQHQQNDLTLKEQLTQLDSRPGNSTKQRRKLLAAIAKETLNGS